MHKKWIRNEGKIERVERERVVEREQLERERKQEKDRMLTDQKESWSRNFTVPES